MVPSGGPEVGSNRVVVSLATGSSTRRSLGGVGSFRTGFGRPECLPEGPRSGPRTLEFDNGVLLIAFVDGFVAALEARGTVRAPDITKALIVAVTVYDEVLAEWRAHATMKTLARIRTTDAQIKALAAKGKAAAKEPHATAVRFDSDRDRYEIELEHGRCIRCSARRFEGVADVSVARSPPSCAAHAGGILAMVGCAGHGLPCRGSGGTSAWRGRGGADARPPRRRRNDGGESQGGA